MGEQPLESTVLHLRAMLAAEQRVSTLLDDCLEPPDAANLSRALLALSRQGFLRADSRAAAELPPGALPEGALPGGAVEPEDVVDALDRAPLTQIGSLAAALPLDLQLSRLVAYGVQFGCAAEAIALAAALALPKPAFRAVAAHVDGRRPVQRDGAPRLRRAARARPGPRVGAALHAHAACPPAAAPGGGGGAAAAGRRRSGG